MYDLPHGYAQTQNRNLKAKFYFYQNKSNRKAVDIRNDARPLILISQVQRSGGTLLSQLFDGHPQCITYPQELMWGKPKKWNWPNGPEQPLACDSSKKNVWDYLMGHYYYQLYEYCKNGYRKYSANSLKKIDHTIHFEYDYYYHKQLFFDNFSEQPNSIRQWLDLYLVSFFNAWISGPSLKSKKYIVAFTPRVNMYEDSVDRFFSHYPDGYFITMTRHPSAWYASMKTHSPYQQLFRDKTGNTNAYALELWKESCDKSLAISCRYPERVISLCYEDLVLSTEAIMRKISDVVSVRFTDTMLNPTFCSQQIYSDSSFKPTRGIDYSAVDRYEHILEPREFEITKKYHGLYDNYREKMSIT